MRIKNIEYTGIGKVLSFMETSLFKSYDRISAKIVVRHMLETCNIRFTIEGCNRLQSTLICELADSYVQQSQRYVRMGADSVFIPEHMKAKEKKTMEEFNELMESCFALYKAMSELKEEYIDVKGRRTAEHYRFGIPIEDARYILPLATTTNVSVAMSGDKILDFLSLMESEWFLTPELKADIHNSLLGSFVDYAGTPGMRQDCIGLFTNELYSDEFSMLTAENNLIFIDGFKNPTLSVAMGAATSGSDKTPSELAESWGEDMSKPEALNKRVLGYGHAGIAEQTRSTFGLMLSLTSYHQYLRHRLPKNHREPLKTLIFDVERHFALPETIRYSNFCGSYMYLVDKIREYRKRLFMTYPDLAMMLLLNCDMVKVISSTNARIDNILANDRICMTAQWEIRDLITKKYEIESQQCGYLYEKSLPPCIYGDCKEGKMTCGHKAEMRAKFAKNGGDNNA